MLCDSLSVNEEVVIQLTDISETKREWIRKIRVEQIGNSGASERRLYTALTKRGVKVYLKMPFIVNNSIYFANLYIPAIKTIIEVSNNYSGPSMKKESQPRLIALKSTGNQVYILSSCKLRSAQYIDRFLDLTLRV